jgi:hypothetical protein
MYRNSQKRHSEHYGVIFEYRQGYGRARAIQDGTLMLFLVPGRRSGTSFKDIDVKHKVLTVGLISDL